MAESKLLVHAIQDVTVVTFRDSTMLDSGVIEAVGLELYALVDEKAVRKIVLDFSTVKFLASQAVGVLITLKKKADAIKGELAICGMREEIMRVFRIMNLMKMFRFFENETRALEAFHVFTA
jgi:anti-anti-sigma factor